MTIRGKHAVGERLRGRQLLKKIYGRFDTEAAGHAYYDFKDLDSIKMKSNELEAFHTAFVDVESGLKDGPRFLTNVSVHGASGPPRARI